MELGPRGGSCGVWSLPLEYLELPALGTWHLLIPSCVFSFFSSYFIFQLLPHILTHTDRTPTCTMNTQTTARSQTTPASRHTTLTYSGSVATIHHSTQPACMHRHTIGLHTQTDTGLTSSAIALCNHSSLTCKHMLTDVQAFSRSQSLFSLLLLPLTLSRRLCFLSSLDLYNQ